MARTLIRHQDIRLSTPGDPGTEGTELDMLKGRYFEASCTALDAVGQYVAITGVGADGLPQVATADPRVSGRRRAIGLVYSKEGTTLCLVQTTGEAVASSLAVSRHYYLGITGLPVETAPLAGLGESCIQQRLGVALSATRLLLAPDHSPIPVLTAADLLITAGDDGALVTI